MLLLLHRDQLLLILLVAAAQIHNYLLSVSRMQVLIDLEPIKLKFVPELLTLLVHDVGNALITVLLLLDVLILLLLVVVVGRFSLPELIDFVYLNSIGLIGSGQLSLCA